MDISFSGISINASIYSVLSPPNDIVYEEGLYELWGFLSAMGPELATLNFSKVFRKRGPFSRMFSCTPISSVYGLHDNSLRVFRINQEAFSQPYQ